MVKKFILPILFLGLVAFLPGTIKADVSCQPIYGGGQTCITTGNILVNKMVQNPQTKQFVDNLTINDPHFAPGDIVAFKVFLRNTGGTTVLQTKIIDSIPPFTNFVSGPGSFDQTSRNLTFTVDNLQPGENREVGTIQVQVVDSKGLSDGVNCEPKNLAFATSNTGQTSQDTSSFCIEKILTKGGLPVFPPSKITTTPPTGPELIPLIGLLPAGLSGWFLRKKSDIKGGKK